MATYRDGGGSTSTAVLEMEEIPAQRSSKEEGPASNHTSRNLSSNSLPPPTTAADVVERWNYPRSNIPKVGTCFWAFIVMGANDAAYGVSGALPFLVTGSELTGQRDA